MLSKNSWARFLHTVTRNKRYVSDLAIVVLLFAASMTFACLPDANPYTKDWKRSTFYERYFGAAVMSACGRGFQHPPVSKIPELYDFLYQETDTFSCDDLPVDLTYRPPSGQQILHHYLHRSIALYWSIAGVSWSGLQPLLGFFFGLVVSTSYCLFRLGMGRLLSFAGAMIFLPLHLTFLPTLRDYAKTPFFLILLLVMGLLVKKRLTRPIFYALSAMAGVVLGVGLGFRSDLLICIPIVLLTIFFFTQQNERTTLRVKALSATLFLGCLAIFYGPVFVRDSHYNNNAHVVIQGLTNKFTDGLAVESSLYEWAHIYSDSWPNFQIRAHHFLYQKHEEPLRYLSKEYNRAGIRFLLMTLLDFPADMLLRAYAAIAKITTIPLVWAGVLLVASVRDRRSSLFLLLIIVYFSGYPALQFSERHLFHMKIVPLWMTGFVAHHMFQFANRTLQTILANFSSETFVKIGRGHRAWLSDSARYLCACAILSSVAVLAPLYLLRWYQHHHVGYLLGSYSEADLEELDITGKPLSENLSMIDSLKISQLTQLPTARDAELRAGYMVAIFSRDRCLKEKLVVSLRYEPGAQHDFSRTVELDFQRHKKIKIFTPIYSTTPSGLGGTKFEGIEISDDSVSCLTNLYMVRNLDRFPPILYVELPDDWREHKRYQTLAERNGRRELIRIFRRSHHRWKQIARNLRL